MKKNLKFYIVLTLLGLSAIVAWGSYFKVYVQQDTVDINAFPREIQGWTSEERTLTDREYEVLETHNVIAREYTSPKGQSVLLLLVYSQNNRKISHPPEICYSGGGLSILEKTKKRIKIDGPYPKSIEFQKLLLEQGRYREISIYWFKIGSQFTASYWKQQGLITWSYLMGRPASSALVRISSAFSKREKSDQDVEDMIKEFAALIVPELLKYLP